MTDPTPILPYATPEPRGPQQSSWGRASVLLWLPVIPLWVVLFYLGNAYHPPENRAMDHMIEMVVICIMFLLLVAGIIAGVLGIRQRHHRRGAAVAGLVLNSFFLLLLALSM